MKNILFVLMFFICSESFASTCNSGWFDFKKTTPSVGGVGRINIKNHIAQKENCIISNREIDTIKVNANNLNNCAFQNTDFRYEGFENNTVYFSNKSHVWVFGKSRVTFDKNDECFNWGLFSYLALPILLLTVIVINVVRS